jgi:hypothetical protein
MMPFMAHAHLQKLSKGFSGSQYPTGVDILPNSRNTLVLEEKDFKTDSRGTQGLLEDRKRSR